MNEQNKSLALLPNGFVDVLPPFAEAEAQSVRTLMDVFRSYGYQQVKPPLLEFESSLLAPGPGARLSSETFRIMDPVSHRMLGVRSDTTAQVARIVHSRLLNAERPLRLMYANDVLRIKGSQLRTERQFTQVGCEFIGDQDEIEADVEICVLSLLGLKAVGVSDITLDMTIPGFVQGLLDEAGDKAEAMEKAVHQRDYDALKAMPERSAQILAQIMAASGDVPEVLEKLSKIEEMAEHCHRLQSICDKVTSAMSALGVDDFTLSVDILEQKGFEYHKHFAFTLFGSHVHGELGRGGRYDVVFGEDVIPSDRQDSDHSYVAKGFTLYMDTVLRTMTPAPKDNVVFASLGASWNEIQELQSQGYIVVRGVTDAQDVPSHCNYVYENGELRAL